MFTDDSRNMTTTADEALSPDCWQGDGSLGFRGGDMNLRRYVGNNPTNSTDPTGLQRRDPDLTEARKQAEREAQARERERYTTISGMYKARIYFEGNWKESEKTNVHRAFNTAAKRISKALAILEDWESAEKKHRHIELPGGKKIERSIWPKLRNHRHWLERQLRSMDTKLRSDNTIIPILNNKDETHPDRNPMYTSSVSIVVTEINRKIKLRSHYWALDADMQAYWTIHEFARFFLLMRDDKFGREEFNGLARREIRRYLIPGVQALDELVEFLQSRN